MTLLRLGACSEASRKPTLRELHAKQFLVFLEDNGEYRALQLKEGYAYRYGMSPSYLPPGSFIPVQVYNDGEFLWADMHEPVLPEATIPRPQCDLSFAFGLNGYVRPDIPEPARAAVPTPAPLKPWADTDGYPLPPANKDKSGPGEAHVIARPPTPPAHERTPPMQAAAMRQCTLAELWQAAPHVVDVSTVEAMDF